MKTLRLILIVCLIVLWENGARSWAEEIPFQGNRLSIKWDSMTGAPLTIRGEKSPLFKIGQVSKLSRARITRIGPILVKKYAPILKIRPDQLRLKAAERTSGNWYVSYWQTFQGTIIYESSLGFSIDPKGRVVSLGAILYPERPGIRDRPR